MMHGHGKSDEAIVAMKPANKAEQSAAELVERRAEAKGNASQQSTRRTPSRESVTQALERIRQVAKAWSLAKPAIRRHSPKVGAVCGKAARTVLCGGRSAMSVPTATCARKLARSAGASPARVGRSEPPGGECCASPAATPAAKRTQLLRGVCD
jgi:hypothetical protein